MFISKLTIRRLKGFRVSFAATSVELQRNKQSTIAPVSCSCENTFVFNTQSLFCNVPY